MLRVSQSTIKQQVLTPPGPSDKISIVILGSALEPDLLTCMSSVGLGGNLVEADPCIVCSTQEGPPQKITEWVSAKLHQPPELAHGPGFLNQVALTEGALSLPEVMEPLVSLPGLTLETDSPSCISSVSQKHNHNEADYCYLTWAQTKGVPPSLSHPV